MTSIADSERPRRRPRREALVVFLPGLAGAGLILLAMRQGWAHVTTVAPRPLPASTIEVAGQDLVPAAGALAVAAVASLAAVLATRAMLRRITGIILAGLGAGIALAVSVGISAADVLATAAATADPATGPAAGSVTAGAQGGSAAPLTGFPGHAAVAALPWRGVAFAGALAIVAAGVMTAWRAERLPVMSSRYDRPVRTAALPAPAAATMWESLSRGEDPTAAESQYGGGGPEQRPDLDARANNGNTGTPAVAEPRQGGVSTAER